ncbi:hypothetical protein J2N86_15175 (plasmid) [Legionella lytica]|uniref:Dot/Icm T4SS effector n=1 Tax=Legionella lytica TaxID=96232 RepID=A0ABY4YCP5_9GAMM|nr:hypothetical protein [Legionella lytica]USQ15301.1 hypothetical protein J2N86_15175 [Legionella lytica]
MPTPANEAKELIQLIKDQNYQQAAVYLLESDNLNSVNASAWFINPKTENKNTGILCDEFLNYLLSIHESDIEPYIKGIITGFINDDIHKNNLAQVLTNLHPILTHPNYLFYIVDSLFKKYPLQEAADLLLQSNLAKKGEGYDILFQTALNQYNAYLLLELKKFNSVLFKEKIRNLDEEKSIRLRKLLSMPEDKYLWFSNYIQPLTHGFGFLGYQEILLVLAQVKKRKTYPFDPVLLKENEYLDFFTALKQNHPIQKRFIISGSHFCYGEIRIDTQERAKLWLIDSLGSTKESSNSKYFNDFIFKFAETFPENEIYVAKEKRQNSPQGCSVFALDDAMHSYTLRLPTGQNDIWDYLSALKTPEKANFFNDDKAFSLSITLCPIPLSLIRTMQSKSVYDEVIPERLLSEQNLIINKKGETTKESSQKFFKLGPQGLRNTRLEYKLEKIIQYTSDFLVNCISEKELKILMHEFTLETFKQHAAKESAEQKISNHPIPKI